MFYRESSVRISNIFSSVDVPGRGRGGGGGGRSFKTALRNMFCVQVSRSSGSGSNLGWGHYVVCFARKSYSHNASLNAGVKMDTREFNAAGNPAME